MNDPYGKILQDFVRFCEVLQVSGRVCNLLQEAVIFCKSVWDFARVRKILQESEMPKNVKKHFLRTLNKQDWKDFQSELPEKAEWKYNIAELQKQQTNISISNNISNA